MTVRIGRWEEDALKKKLPVFIGIFVLAILIVISIFYQVNKNSVKMNTGYVEGNSAGNIYNNGLFCEQDGLVYFSNAYDNGALYVMNPDETNIRKLLDASVELINVDENNIYYYQLSSSGDAGLGYVRSQSGLYRCTTEGNKATSISEDTIFCLQLVNNNLYYMATNAKGGYFYKQCIDGSDPVLLSQNEIFAASVKNGVLYFNGRTVDHELYSLDTSNDNISEVWAGNLWNPIVIDDYVYYMDIAHNYRLCRYSMSQNVIEVLTEDRIDFFNIGSGKIFYQRSSKTDPGLIRMNLDGSNNELIAEGIFSEINMTSQYVYYHNFGSDVPMYHTAINGPAIASTFDAARNATFK